VLYIYQLKDRQAFARLTFEDFLSGKSDADLLGEELINKTERVMLPGTKESLNAALLPDTRFVGVVAMYRLPAPQQWRYLIPAEQIREKSFWRFSDQKNISIRLHDCYMTVDGVELDLIPGQRSDLPTTCSVQNQISPAPALMPTAPAQTPPQTSSVPALPQSQLPTQTLPSSSLPTIQVPEMSPTAVDQATTLLRNSIN
jgi:type VI secretion system protein VasD